MKLLITAGATREAIDPVRYLSNVSTGKTGAALATEFSRRGHVVTLLRGEGSAAPTVEVAIQSFGSALDLQKKLQVLLTAGNFDVVIMAAAVADYRPEAVASGKLSSDEETLTLNLVRNAKILPQLRGFSARPLVVIGFKLTVGADAAARNKAVADQFTTSGVDAVVHNDLDEIAENEGHLFRLFIGPEKAQQELIGVAVLAQALDEYIGPRTT
jgi:phosphopantothenate---cysteine ligase (CTP)